MSRIRLRLGRPLLASAARPWAGAMVACSVVFVAVLGVLFAHKTKADSFDDAIDTPIIAAFSSHGGLAYRLTYPGTLYPAVVLTGIIVVICLLTGRINGALLAAAAVPVADGLDDGLLKHLVDRTYLGQLTYPSGHTTAVFASVTTIVVLFLIPPQPQRARVAWVLVAATGCATGVIVAIAVIALQWHTFTDTVAGAAVGIGTVCALALILDQGQPVIRRTYHRFLSHKDGIPDAGATPTDEEWILD